MFRGRGAKIEQGPGMESGESAATEVAVEVEVEEKETEKPKYEAELYFLLGESTPTAKGNIKKLILAVLEREGVEGVEITSAEFYQERGGLRQGLKVSLSISAETAKAAFLNAKKLAYKVESGLSIGTTQRDLKAERGDGGVFVAGYEIERGRRRR